MKSTEPRFGGSGRHRRTRFSFEQRQSPFRARVTSRRWIGLVVVVMVLAGAVGAGVVVLAVHRAAEARSRAALERTVRDYLAGWQRSDWNAMRALVAAPPATFADAYRQMFDSLKVSKAEVAHGAITTLGSSAAAAFSVKLSLSGLGDWSYTGRLSLTKVGSEWRVRWSPSSVHPALKPGDRFARTRRWPARAPILARDGQELTIQGQVVTVGVQLGRIKDRQKVIDALRLYAGVDPATTKAVLDRPGAKPDWFLPVITLRRSRYEQVKPQLYPVPGIVFQSGTARILLDEGFAQQVIGRVHQATAEDLKRLGPPYRPGDVVGAYGLELAFERQLAGSPSGSVELLDANKHVVSTLHEFRGGSGKPLRTTIDVGIQRAAEAALNGVNKPAALVALDPRTGDVRAVVSRPVDGLERALSGRYPPGSTFKVVTSAALMENGLGLSDTTTCPQQVVAGGKVFRNFEGEALGTITFRDAFAKSCNTAFIQLASKLPSGALETVAGTFGFGHKYILDLPAFGGQFPPPVDDAERAAAAIGQGRVLASPVHMASVAAAADTGEWRLPRLITTDPTITERPLPKGVAASLRELMGLVVTQGTAAGAGLPAGTAGKTGTAEFGTNGQTHAWFVGFRGNLAFAVLVEGGGVGGRVAAPIAATFLKALP